jgi:hypothetical protein
MNDWDDLLADALGAIEGSPRARARNSGTYTENPSTLEGNAKSDHLIGGWCRETDKASELDDPDLRDALAAVEDELGATTVLAITDRPSYSGHLVDGDLDDFHAAVDQLDRETCRGSRCQAGHRCRRHTRRRKA